jgi:simple sugar transport system permease protein
MLSSFLAASVIAGTPLLFGILGEILTEKSGKLNLGVEGMMLMGAVIGFLVALKTQSAILGISSAALAGAFGAFIFGFLTITLRTNQVVTGLALTIFGTGFSGFVGKQLVGEVVPQSVKDFFHPVAIPLLGKIPFIGPILFNHSIYVYLGYVSALLIGFYLYHTRKGLNLRAVGENTAAADASGINVSLYKYVHTLVGGALCGLAGAFLSLVYVPAWQENITAGRGWIAIALVIFCKWNPYLAVVGSIVFGGLDIIGFRIQQFDIAISQYLIDMLPYAVTVIVLIIASIRESKENQPPKELGNPYFRENK